MKRIDADRSLHRAAVVALCCSALAVGPAPLQAGDLNTEVNNMFNSLGAIGNYTAPGAFRGQTFNTYTGGSLFMRAPNKVYQLAAIQFPSARAGCGGIDVFGGSFSHISAAEFKNMLRNITAALPGIAFQLALESVSPLLGGLTKWAKGLETWINNARINSCETAKAIVSTAAEAAGFSSQEACSDLAIEMGLETDRDAARRRCATDRPSILASARSSGDANIRNKAPFVGNLTWKALQRTGTYLDDQERELIMSIVGTVIFYPEDAARDPEPVAPTITSISQLLYGQAAGTGTNVTQHLLRCNNYTDCDVVTLNTSYTHTPFTARVETMMRSIADKIATRTAIPNNSAEVGFVNQTTEPVYKMLSIGATIPGHGGPRQGLHPAADPAGSRQPGEATGSGHAAAVVAGEEPAVPEGRLVSGGVQPPGAARAATAVEHAPARDGHAGTAGGLPGPLTHRSAGPIPRAPRQQPGGGPIPRSDACGRSTPTRTPTACSASSTPRQPSTAPATTWRLSLPWPSAGSSRRWWPMPSRPRSCRAGSGWPPCCWCSPSSSCRG
jgi:conjugative transfer pilus assembly protein TraH